MSKNNEVDFAENPVATLAGVVKNPTAMGAAGVALGIGSEAAIFWDNKRPFNLKNSLIVGTCAGAVGVLGSSLISATSKPKISKNNSWSERIHSEEGNVNNDLGVASRS